MQNPKNLQAVACSEMTDRMQQISPRSFLCFLVVGGSATLLQYLIMFVLIRYAQCSEGYASATGYVISTAYNYCANASLTFHGKHRHTRSLPRFLLTALAGLGINQMVLLGLLRLHTWLPMAQIAATVCVLVWNYLVNALWSFRTHHPS